MYVAGLRVGEAFCFLLGVLGSRRLAQRRPAEHASLQYAKLAVLGAPGAPSLLGLLAEWFHYVRTGYLSAALHPLWRIR